MNSSSLPLNERTLNKTYKVCFVPECKSTTIKNPDKLFFSVPQDPSERKKWFKIAGRKDLPTTSRYYCCENHFDLKNDMENYIRFQIYGGNLKLKREATPHKFECQQNRQYPSRELNRDAYYKINRRRQIEEMLSEVPSSSKISKENSDPHSTEVAGTMLQEKQEISATAVDAINTVFDQPSASTSSSTMIREFGEESYMLEQIRSMKSTSSTGTQVRLSDVIHHRSRYVTCKPSVSDFSCNTTSVETCDAACSPKSVTADSINSDLSARKSSTCTSSEKPSSDLYVPSSSSNVSSLEEQETGVPPEMKQLALKMIRYNISRHPKAYIGIVPECLWILDLIKKHYNISEDNIMLILMKIKINDSYERLANQFGISTSQASRIFNNNIKSLSIVLKQLIYLPTKQQVKKNLTIPFRAFYSHVFAVIDAFEIQIEKPSDPVQQALTWSEYKKCNTLKYLIGSTPDGLIIFVSKGFGGRISDIMLFEESEFMNILPDNVAVMADRGFKHIDNLLNRKGCLLIRPPSVSEGKPSTKDEVLETKRIASLRIHIERVIGRVREYEMLKPHATLCLSHMKAIDDIMYVVCGLINLQYPIIRN